jgi:plasmid stabilization system protein ParE
MPAVLDDYVRISEHIGAWSGNVAAADATVESIRAAVRRLDAAPHRGVPRDDLLRGARAIVHEQRFVIVYTVDEAAHRVIVLGVFDGKQDYALLFDQRLG